MGRPKSHATEKLAITVTPEQKAMLKELKERFGLSFSAVVRMSIALYYQEHISRPLNAPANTETETVDPLDQKPL